LIGFNRKVLEEILYRQRRQELDEWMDTEQMNAASST
jgi:hypothetical protein